MLDVQLNKRKKEMKTFTLGWLYHGKDPQSTTLTNTTLARVQAYIRLLKNWGCLHFSLVDNSGKTYHINHFGTIEDQS